MPDFFKELQRFERRVSDLENFCHEISILVHKLEGEVESRNKLALEQVKTMTQSVLIQVEQILEDNLK